VYEFGLLRQHQAPLPLHAGASRSLWAFFVSVALSIYFIGYGLDYFYDFFLGGGSVDVVIKKN